jgi:hypothetical protein
MILKVLNFLSVILLVAVCTLALTAQDFINNTSGTYVAGANGFIRMKGTGVATGSESNGAFTGTAALGTSTTTRIPGTVIWAKTGNQDVVRAAGQTVVYFTNLGVAGTGVKTFPGNATADVTNTLDVCADPVAENATEIAGTNNTYVSGTFLHYGTGATGVSGGRVTSPTVVPTITHECGQIFTYDGNGLQAVLNTSGQQNLYSVLRINQGTYTTTAQVATILASEIVTAAVAKVETPLYQVGTLDLVIPTSCTEWNTVSKLPPSTFSDTVWLACGAELLDDVDISVCANGTIYIPDPSCVDVDIACDATTTYHNINLNTTADGIKYGNLVLDIAGNKTIDASTGDIVVCNDVDVLQTVTVDGGGSGNGINIVGGDGNVNGGDMDFANCAEVIGWVKRSVYVAGTEYHFNNIMTTAKITTIPTSDFFGIFNVPSGISNPQLTTSGGSNLAKVTEGYDYINRLTKVAMNGVTLSELNVGFLTNEVYTMAAGGGAQSTTGYDAGFRGKVRGLEAFAITKDPLAFQGEGVKWESEDAGTCFAQMHIVTPLGITTVVAGEAADGINIIGDKNQILFSAQPLILYSQRNGRWSDPKTWYGGATPMSADSVVIGDVVYTGLYTPNATGTDPLFGTPSTNRNWGVNEYNLPGLDAVGTNDVMLAQSVTIVTPAEAIAGTPGGYPSYLADHTGTRHPALVIGNSETEPTAPNSYLFDGVTADCNPTPSDMDFSKGLYFGEIINRNGTGTAWTEATGDGFGVTGTSTNWAGLRGSAAADQMGGIFIMRGRETSATGAFVAITEKSKLPFGPILGAVTLTNSGRIFAGSIFDIGQ